MKTTGYYNLLSSTSTRKDVPRRFVRRGAVLVELAISLPLMFLTALAAADLGSVVHAYVVVTNSARTGATEGSMNNFSAFTREFWESEIRSAVVEDMRGLRGFDEAKVAIDIVVTETDDDLFRVAVDVMYPFDTAVDWPGLPASIDLHYRSEMRRMR